MNLCHLFDHSLLSRRDTVGLEFAGRSYTFDELDRVSEVDAEAVARAETALCEEVRDAIASDVDFAEGVGAAGEFQADDIAAAY